MFNTLRNWARKHYFLRLLYRDVYSHRSISDSVRAFFRYTHGWIRGDIWSFHQSRQHLEVSQSNLTEILKTAYEFHGYGSFWHITPIQDPASLKTLVREVEAVDPSGVVEIGTASGGTLFVWSKYFDADTVISVDLPNVPNMKKSRLFWEFRDDDAVYLIHGNSHCRETRAQLAAVTESTDIEFLFIDGDHSYEGVKQDYQMYAPFVTDGGIIASDDIGKSSAEVSRFWNEISDESETTVIRDSDGTPEIGLIHVSE